MPEVVDARGLACPQPVIRTREAMGKGAEEILVLVDDSTARDNVSRFAASQGFSVEVREEEGAFRMVLRRSGGTETGEKTAAGAPSTAAAAGRVIVLSEDIMGRGDRELGEILIKAFLNTLAESGEPPRKIVLFNRGVLLAVEGADTVESLRNLAKIGVEILVCGTCLNYFGMTGKTAVGTVSNMYEILHTLMTSENTVTL
jgi:selenium metabolism protein YedF